MVCIDIGHSTVKVIDFVQYIPTLKYLILTWTGVQDLSSISSCKQLLYLDMDYYIVRDYTPL